MEEKQVSTINFLNRCSNCRKKTIVLTECPCKKHFCLKCRYPEEHECTFDYKQKAVNELVKNNPIVVAEKISKI